jgi:hypothetical protein
VTFLLWAVAVPAVLVRVVAVVPVDTFISKTLTLRLGTLTSLSVPAE